MLRPKRSSNKAATDFDAVKSRINQFNSAVKALIDLKMHPGSLDPCFPVAIESVAQKWQLTERSLDADLAVLNDLVLMAAGEFTISSKMIILSDVYPSSPPAAGKSRASRPEPSYRVTLTLRRGIKYSQIVNQKLHKFIMEQDKKRDKFNLESLPAFIGYQDALAASK